MRRGRETMRRSPTFDNLVKSVCDALQIVSGYPDGLLYKDDQQVSVLVARKLWADPKIGSGLSLIVCRVQDADGDVWRWLNR